MVKNNVYSILIKNNFKLIDDDCFYQKIMWHRGYIFAFIKYVINKEDKEILKDILPRYTDEQWTKLLNRLYENGHVDKMGLYD